MNKKILSLALMIAFLPLLILATVGGASAEVEEPMATAFMIWEAEQDNFNTEFQAAIDTCDPRFSYAPQKRKVIVNNPQISGIVKEVTSDSANGFEKTYNLYGYVSNRYSYQVYPEWRDTNEILGTTTGDCTDQSILLASLLKNAGIEAYIVHGDKVDGYTHAWTVALVDGKWLQLDPTTDNFYFVENCLKENCEQEKLYQPVAGMFTNGASLECSN